MKNSLIVEYEAKSPFELITNIFNDTKELAKQLNMTPNYCRHMIARKRNHKGFKYERVWFKNGESIEV